MNFSDILGLGKILPIDKLIDVVSIAVGRVSKSYFDRIDVDTKAYEIKTLADAKAVEMKTIASAMKENFKITGGIEYKENQLLISSPKQLSHEDANMSLVNPSLEDRTTKRIAYQEAKKQHNIESITANAGESLKNEKEVTDKPLDEDWITRFFAVAAEISNEEMQVLWGQILAGEIKQPNSYSLKTLEVLRNLTKDDAELFMRVARLCLSTGRFYFIINPDDQQYLPKEHDIKFSDLVVLDDLGLISSTVLDIALFETDEERSDVIQHGNKGLVLVKEKGTPQQTFKVHVFTKVGIELQRLVDKPHDEKYIRKLAKLLKHEKIKFLTGDFVSNDDDTWKLANPTEITLE